MPPAVLAWLQDLLRERFHDGIVLEPERAGFCALCVPGNKRRVWIRSEFAAFELGAKDLPCGHWIPAEPQWLPEALESLPAPGMAEPPVALVEHDERGYVLHYDVLGLAYWMMTRLEEVDAQRLDAHGRFPAEASHAFRHGYLDRPIVDEWFEVLSRIMRAAWPELPSREPKYDIRLSHDVDTPARYGLIGPLRLLRVMLVDLMRERERDRQALMRAPRIWSESRQRLDTRDPFNTFDWIMDQSEAVGLRNAFYFLCGRTDRKRDGHYVPEDPAILDLMRRIHARGHEIGLHPSFNTYLDPDALRGEANRLRRACEQAGIQQEHVGARMHYLRWQSPATLRNLEAAGMAYDTTLGYADHPGFRCGTCHEYQAFDPVKCKAMKLRIRPLIVMESTVIGGMRPQGVLQAHVRLRRLMEACRRVNGQFTLLWHNTMLEHPHQRRLYELVLAHRKEHAK